MSPKYFDELDEVAKKCYTTEIASVNGLDPYNLTNKEKNKYAAEYPDLSYFDIVNYLVYNKSAYTQEEFRSYKSLTAYKQFACKWVKEVVSLKIEQFHLVLGKALSVTMASHASNNDDDDNVQVDEESVSTPWWRCCCPKKKNLKSNDDDNAQVNEEPDSTPWWRCCCPKKKNLKSMQRKLKGKKKRESVALAQKKLQNVSEEDDSAPQKYIEPKYLPLTFIPDFIIGEIFAKSFSEIPYHETGNVVLLMADVSGFTSLCESYCEKGVGGIEELASVLNGFMSTLSAMLIEGGGDILNFAGDAFLVQWIPEGSDKGMHKAAKRAYKCAIALQSHQCLQTKNLDGTLKIKIGIATGEVTTWILGSSKDFLLFVASGPTLDTVATAESLCSPCDIVVDKDIYSLLKEEKIRAFTPVELDNGYVKVTEYPPAEGEDEPIPNRILLFTKCEDEDIQMAKVFLIPGLRGLKSTDELQYVSELSMVTILFVALLNVEVAHPNVLDSSFEIIFANVLKHQGVLNKMLLFDKGCTFLVVFGLPGLKHSNDAARGVLCADDISSKLREIDVKCSIGVASGTCFCGLVGHQQRQEYTVIGSRVNMAARIMAVYNDQPIALNVETYHLSRDQLGQTNFFELPPRKMKGIDSSGAIYAYRKSIATARETDSVATFDVVEDSNLYGSEKEKRKIQECIAAMCNEDHRNEMKSKTLLPVLIIKGQSSSGKSYLMYYSIDCAIAMNYKFAVCCTIPSYHDEPFSVISTLIKRMLGITMTESSIDREDMIMSFLPNSSYHELYLFNHLFDCEFPMPETIHNSQDYRTKRFTSLAKIIIHEFCSDHYTLIAVDNADFMDDQSWYIIHQLAEEENVLIVLSLSLDFKEVNASASVLLLKAYMHVNQESSEEDHFAPLLCWFLAVKAVHTSLFVYLKEITGGKVQLLKEISLSPTTAQLFDIVPFESIDKERLQKEFYVDDFKALGFKEPLACDLKPGIRIKDVWIPTNTNDSVKETLNHLTIQDRLLLKRASVLGIDFDLHTLESVSPGASRSEVLKSIMNLLSHHIFTSVCSQDGIVDSDDSSKATVALESRNICLCFHIYLRTGRKNMKGPPWPITPYHRLKFRTQEFRTCVLASMTKEQIYSMRVDVADILESNGHIECALCKGNRIDDIDASVMHKEVLRYPGALKECSCLKIRPKLYSEISVLYITLGMVFLPVYFKRKAAQAANCINFPIQALYYIQKAEKIMPEYSLMSDNDIHDEEAYIDPLILKISLKKTEAQAYLILGDTYTAAMCAFQAMDMVGLDALCFHGAFKPHEFKKILPKFRMLHAECITKLIGVFAKVYLKAHVYKVAQDLLRTEYYALKLYPIDFIQILSHMISMYQLKYWIQEHKKLADLERNIFKHCRERVQNFDVLLDLSETIEIGKAYAIIIQTNIALAEFEKSENIAKEAIQILDLVNDQVNLPLIRSLLCIIYYYTENYTDYSKNVFELSKMEAASKNRRFRALYICCFSMFLTKSLEGIHQTEVQLSYDKCNTFASVWKHEKSRVMPTDLALFVSVILTNWCLYADESTAWIAGENVFKQCYGISVDLQKTIAESKHNFWTIYAIIMLLEIQVRGIEKPFKSFSADKNFMKQELNFLKPKIKTNYPCFMEAHKKLEDQINKMLESEKKKVDKPDEE